MKKFLSGCVAMFGTSCAARGRLQHQSSGAPQFTQPSVGVRWMSFPEPESLQPIGTRG